MFKKDIWLKLNKSNKKLIKQKKRQILKKSPIDYTLTDPIAGKEVAWLQVIKPLHKLAVIMVKLNH